MRALSWAIAVWLFSMTWQVRGAELLRDVPYASPGGVPLALDASIPDGRGPFPALIVVHGGGWVRGDKRIDVEPLFNPLSRAGFAWFSIDYRLASSALQFGAAVGDVENAIRFIKLHAAEYRIDPDRIALIGESAGAQLAAMAALSGDPHPFSQSRRSPLCPDGSRLIGQRLRSDSAIDPGCCSGHPISEHYFGATVAAFAHRQCAPWNAAFPLHSWHGRPSCPVRAIPRHV